MNNQLKLLKAIFSLNETHYLGSYVFKDFI